MRFLNTLKEHLPVTPPAGTAEGSLLTFMGEKGMAETCTNCGLCYNLCPTGALTSADDRREILFGKLLCVNCHLCSDVCPVPETLVEKESVAMEGIFEGKREELARFRIRHCMECGTAYTYDGQNTCPRCRALEEDARDLSGF